MNKTRKTGKNSRETTAAMTESCRGEHNLESREKPLLVLEKKGVSRKKEGGSGKKGGYFMRKKEEEKEGLSFSLRRGEGRRLILRPEWGLGHNLRRWRKGERDSKKKALGEKTRHMAKHFKRVREG